MGITISEGLRRIGVRAGAATLVAALSITGADAGSDLAPDDIALLNTASFGVTSSLASEYVSLGSKRWLAQQLRPGTIRRLPGDAEQVVASLPGSARALVDLVRELDEQNRAANATADPEEKKVLQKAYQTALNELGRAAATRTILFALYDPDQLRERAALFWLNHFSVSAGKANLRALVGDYMDSAIRPRALGRFRDLLGAIVRHPAMLRFLDNADNAVGHVNENYARELMELHTMGVGSGYGQADVEALARILTGVAVDARPDDPRLKPEWRPLLRRDGLFIFNPARHDFTDKVLLGHTIRGSGFGEVEEALDILAREPATSRHVSRRMAAYFLGGAMPDALIDRMASTFRRTDGDIASVLEAMFAAPEFHAALPGRFKDPIAFVLSALRLAYDGRVILNAGPVQGWLGRLGQPLFGRSTPDGYPLDGAAWSGPGQMTTRFDVAKQIGSGPAGLFKAPDGAERPAFPLLQNALYFDRLAARLAPATRAALADAVSPQDWNTLFLSSPDFMH